MTLTRKQQRVLEALRRLEDRSGARRAAQASGLLPATDVEHVALDGWHLSYDVAQEAEVDNRAVGAVLASLYRRQLAQREHRPHDRVYVWRLA